MANSETGLISVIIPVFNAESTLHRAVDSILAQSHIKFELLLSNDGSNDNSSDICKNYASRDPRITVIHGKNGGPSAARNRALSICKGEFIFFLDADDYILPNALELLLESQKTSNSDIVVGDFCKKISGKTVNSGHMNAFSNDTVLDAKALRAYVIDKYLSTPNEYHLFSYVWGRLLRTSLILENSLRFDENLHYYEDVSFNFDLLPHIKTLNFVSQIVLHKIVDKHDGHALGHQLTTAGAWKQFGYSEALIHVSNYLTAEKNEPIDSSVQDQLNITFVIYTIITLIRLCGYTNRQNWRQILILVRRVLTDNRLHSGLSYYTPSGRNSRLIPLLLRWRLAYLILIYCTLKSRLRYH